MEKFICCNFSYLALLGLVKGNDCTVVQLVPMQPMLVVFEKAILLVLSYIPCATRINSPKEVQFRVKLRRVSALTAKEVKPQVIFLVVELKFPPLNTSVALQDEGTATVIFQFFATISPMLVIFKL